ncbi:hypothetical protein [Microbacterium maritypicum]|uniref:hypothetical protein n=1 Tax=Microbacterium maritypicum TaxID=33918 RepID=UPI001B322A55|nr:hypothetical protein [Microbacterium liquefaciens]MBP5802956.1 hypothetical protein [Microbacterium liquefaciens]
METASPRSDPPKRRGAANPSTVLSVLGSAAVGVVVTWWISVGQRVPVHADADLASVRFGFPLPWITQDHSSNPFVAYPQEVALRLTGRTGISYPTEYDWASFAGDALIWGGVFWVIAMVGLPALVRTIRGQER